VQRLLAPSAAATSGLTLNGQTLGSQGNWAGHPSAETVAQLGGSYTVTIPGRSAAIVTVSALTGTT
jgi:hypothetical protein